MRQLPQILAAFLCSLELVTSWSDYHDANCAANRVAIVHLFEWKWADIANECERFLGPRGFCGVQVSPATEHAVITTDAMRPWWERYQPVSYKLQSRSGDETEFVNMVRRCNAVGVRIYVDVILNHMAGMGRSGHGSGGSYFKSDDGSFPGVPYTMADFNNCSQCPACCCINSWTDLTAVRVCRLSGLIDINQKKEYVRQKQAEFLNKMIQIGVAGFRVDAAKHMFPEDLKATWERLDELSTEFFPAGSKPFMFLEVIDQSQNAEVRAQWYTGLGRVTELRYCTKIKEAINALWMVRGIWDEGWGMLKPEDALVFVDNHDNQRGHGGGGSPLNFNRPKDYKKAQALTLANTYGYPRLMSSYRFTSGNEGPPHNPDFSTKDVVIGDDGTCTGGWVCEHRWTAITAMVGFAKAVSGQGATNWWQDGNQVAFSRGNKGLFAMTNHGGLDTTLQTGLPAGQYCDVIQGCPTDTGCTGDVISVGSDGRARIRISNPEEPFLAIHVEAKAGSGGCDVDWTPPPSVPTMSSGSTPTVTSNTTSTSSVSTSGPATSRSTARRSTLATTREPGAGDWRRTVVFVSAHTQFGNNLFIRGGIGHDRRSGCVNNAESSPCALSIDHNRLGTGTHYAAYNAWRIGDTKLDWYGAQRNQGSFNGQQAEGSPAAWTTNERSHVGYQPLNKWGRDYWMLDVELDCNETEDGWFEVKALVTGWGWERDVNQWESCSGDAGGSRPYVTHNHMAHCGKINVFQWNTNSCVIDDF